MTAGRIRSGPSGGNKTSSGSQIITTPCPVDFANHDDDSGIARRSVREEAHMRKAAAKFGVADKETEMIQRFKATPLAETEETLDLIGGLTLELEIIREIYSLRGNEFATAPIRIETRA